MSGIEVMFWRLGVVPAVVVEDARAAAPLAGALAEGGIPCVEVTFRTAAAEDAIRAIARERPDVVVGAGTVLSRGQAERAIAAGARFVVSPGLDEGVVTFCRGEGVAVFPGCATATEVTRAHALGLAAVKFFPCAQLGGLPAIRALAGPFGGMRFLPTGGVGEADLREFLACDRVLACGGTWVAPKALIAVGDFDAIAERARRSAAIVRSVRGGAGE